MRRASAIEGAGSPESTRCKLNSIPSLLRFQLSFRIRRVGARCQKLLVLILLLTAGRHLWAASSAENRAFDAAKRSFLEGVWDKAEEDFANFGQTFTNSARLPEAVLFQAESRLHQTNYDGAIALLSAHESQAGKFADEYLFWQAYATLQLGQSAHAAEMFARLVRDFPSSSRRLEAAFREAYARANLSDWTGVVGVLEQTNGVFRLMARTNATNELVVRGFLLLTEAELARNSADAAEAALAAVPAAQLIPELAWHRQYLLCRLALARNQTQAALQNSTNLTTLANAAGQPALKAESAALQADIFQRLGRLEEAIAAYRNNLAGDVPADRQREALLRITELCLAQHQIPEAAQTLEKFLAQTPPPANGDLALVTLGELRLRQCEGAESTNAVLLAVTNAPAATNCLDLALAPLNHFTNQFPQSPLLGRAQLARGWCYWFYGKLPESRDAFQAAVERLPLSADQAQAYFKLADVEFRQTNYAAAISHYHAILDKFAGQEEVRTNLFEPALYQIVQAGKAGNDLSATTNALAKILTWFPNGFHTGSALLLTGQMLQQSDPEAAREQFLQFERAAPGSPLLPQVELAVARTFEREDRWPEAIERYDQWLTKYTNHEAQAQALYCRAQANFRVGNDTNALVQLTNFVARFPTNNFAPLAQLAVADYYYSLGDWQHAEENYQWCYFNTNWQNSPLRFPAYMMAGRAAFARQSWKDAADYFTSLARNPNCPPELQAQALFAYGDTCFSQNSTNKLADYQEAFNAFDRICKFYSTNRLAVLALGQKANCLFQSQDYAGASNVFQQVLQSPQAAAATRSGAQVLLGLTLEKLAEKATGAEQRRLLEKARDLYLDVFHQAILRDGEIADRFWTMRAGLEAGRIEAEKLKQPGAAANIYREVSDRFPFLRLEEKIRALESQEQESGKKS